MTLPEVVVIEPEVETLVGAGMKKEFELVTLTDDAVNERERERDNIHYCSHKDMRKPMESAIYWLDYGYNKGVQ